MIIIQSINWFTDYRLDQFGIEPRTWSGLLGVLFAPLLHGSWGHLWSNLVPLVIMGTLITLSSMRQFIAVTVLVWLVSGLGVWLVAPAGSITVGASGIVFGWLAFLIVRGIWTRSWQHILLGLVLLARLRQHLLDRDRQGGRRGHHRGGHGVLAGRTCSGPSAASSARSWSARPTRRAAPRQGREGTASNPDRRPGRYRHTRERRL